MPKDKPIICLDFDGVIHSYERGWQGGEIYGTVVDGFFEWAWRAKGLFRLMVYSSRSKSPEGLAAMRDWLEEHLIEWSKSQKGHNLYLSDFEWAAEKPPAFLTIDDRAVQFRGDWNDLDLQPARLLSFRPWMSS